MATEERLPKPQELATAGLLNVLSMKDFSPDQRLVDEALNGNVPRQQGGVCDQLSGVPAGSSQLGRRGSPLPSGLKS